MDENGDLKERIISVLRTIYDPEMPVDIYEMGLIYDLAVGADGRVDIRMTLTAPACPVAGTLPVEVERRVLSVPGVTGAHVEVVWDPPWSPERMTEAARLTIGL